MCGVSHTLFSIVVKTSTQADRSAIGPYHQFLKFRWSGFAKTAGSVDSVEIITPIPSIKKSMVREIPSWN